jgi:hypothetical protein
VPRAIAPGELGGRHRPSPYSQAPHSQAPAARSK